MGRAIQIHRRSLPRRRLERETNRKRAPLPGLAVDQNLTAMRQHDVLHDREPQTTAFDVMDETRSDSMEAFEDLLLFRARNPDPLVAHGKIEPVLFAPQRNDDLLSVAGILDGVVHQVGQGLPDGVAIDNNLRRAQRGRLVT